LALGFQVMEGASCKRVITQQMSRALGAEVACDRIPSHIINTTWSTNIVIDCSFFIYPWM